MSRPIIRRMKPEEEELLRKREELATIRATLAERELELVDLRSELAAFEGRYLRQVGTLYAELDEWKARISELDARIMFNRRTETETGYSVLVERSPDLFCRPQIPPFCTVK